MTSLRIIDWQSESNKSSGNMHKLHSGGIERAIRRKSAISVASSEQPAGTKCQFSAPLP